MEIDFATLREPVDPDDPNGPDLSDEPDFSLFEVDLEGFLPTKADDYYFGFRKPNSDLGGFADRCTAMLERTRDLRLLVPLAKLAALSGSIGQVADTLSLIRTLLTEHWETLHPRGGSTFNLRAVSLERLDEFASFVLPLQYVPIISDRNGNICFRDQAVADGSVLEREGDTHPSSNDIDRILTRCEMDNLIAARDLAARMVDDVAAIIAIWAANADDPPSITFTRLPPMLDKIKVFLDGAVAQRDPSLALAGPADEEETEGDADSDDDDGETTAPVGSITSLADAKAALTAASRYFERNEPSSPALLLVRKGVGLIGLTFPQVMQQIAPDDVFTSAIQLSNRRNLSLPMEKLTDEFADLEIENAADEEPSQSYVAPNRKAALALMAEVAKWYRGCEPSNPIPLLLDKARDLMSKDFTALLGEIAVQTE